MKSDARARKSNDTPLLNTLQIMFVSVHERFTVARPLTFRVTPLQVPTRQVFVAPLGA